MLCLCIILRLIHIDNNIGIILIVCIQSLQYYIIRICDYVINLRALDVEDKTWSYEYDRGIRYLITSTNPGNRNHSDRQSTEGFREKKIFRDGLHGKNRIRLF